MPQNEIFRRGSVNPGSTVVSSVLFKVTSNVKLHCVREKCGDERFFKWLGPFSTVRTGPVHLYGWLVIVL